MVKVYAAQTDTLADEDLFRLLYQKMPSSRKEKVDRMAFPKDKRLSLGAGALLDYALSTEGIFDREFIFWENHKPALKNSDIGFNLSHSGNAVFCAVADTDVGCDVERIKNIDMKLAARFFSHDEYEAIASCAALHSRNDMFFRYWTLKESFIKATGLGLGLALNDFCIVLNGNDISVRQNVDDRIYHFKEYDLHDGYKYAVCCADRNDLPENIVRVDLRDVSCI